MGFMDLILLITVIVFVGSAIYMMCFFIFSIKCLNKTKCSDTKCRYRNVCDKWEKPITEDDIKKAKKMIETLD